MKTMIIFILSLFQLMAFSFSSAIAVQPAIPFLDCEESYIDDIPFDTEAVFKAYKQTIFPVQIIDVAAYIDDIPFETEKVVSKVNAAEAMQIQFEMPAETKIDDIPFDTEKIAGQVIGSASFRM